MQEITVFDSNGNSMTNLVQWDKDVKVFIKEDEIDKSYNVHFFNKNNQNTAMVVESTFQNGMLSAIIPNDLLAEPFPIIGYIYVEKNNERKSIYGFRIVVRKRPRPANYVYSDQKEYITFEKVLKEAKEYSNNALNYYMLSMSYSIGEGNVRENENIDSAKYYYEQSHNSSNDAKKYADSAKSSEENSALSEQISFQKANEASNYSKEALNYSKTSESWAIGNTGIREGENENSSKYYCQQSKYNSELSKVYFETIENVTNEALDTIKNALDGGSLNFEINLSTGHLMYNGQRILFSVNNNGHLEWGIIL